MIGKRKISQHPFYQSCFTIHLTKRSFKKCRPSECCIIDNWKTVQLIFIYDHPVEWSILMLNRFLSKVARSAVLLLACFFITFSCLADSPIVPDAQKTPGDALTTDASIICVPGQSEMFPKLSKSRFIVFTG